MSKSATLLVASLVIGLTAFAAKASDTLWSHNGSVVRYLSENDRRLLIYEQPRAALRAQGVQPGTILFDGLRSGDRIAGTARIFKRGCRRSGYPVSGTLTSETVIVLSGRSNEFAADGCGVVMSSGNSDDRLVFRYIGHATGQRPHSAP